MQGSTIVLAGATGNLGGRMATALVHAGANARALVRHETPQEKTERIRSLGVQVASVDLHDAAQVAEACSGASCVVSALAGLREVIVDAQTVLLEAAVKASVPRFIPSDYSIDFTRLPVGQNRNLDLRREFHARLAKAPIVATSIFNGAFMDMLTGQAPFILFKFKRVLCWGNADQRMDFTTIDDTAAFTAAAGWEPSDGSQQNSAADDPPSTGSVQVRKMAWSWTLVDEFDAHNGLAGSPTPFTVKAVRLPDYNDS